MAVWKVVCASGPFMVATIAYHPVSIDGCVVGAPLDVCLLLY